MLTYINVLKEKKATTNTSKFPVRMLREIAISLTAIVKVEQAGRMINWVWDNSKYPNWNAQKDGKFQIYKTFKLDYLPKDTLNLIIGASHSCPAN